MKRREIKFVAGSLPMATGSRRLRCANPRADLHDAKAEPGTNSAASHASPPA
jgi:hypothetical protein